MSRTTLAGGREPLLTDIMALSGYSSEVAFRQAFQIWMGVLPSYYKRGIRRPREKKTEEVSPGSERTAAM